MVRRKNDAEFKKVHKSKIYCKNTWKLGVICCRLKSMQKMGAVGVIVFAKSKTGPLWSLLK